MPPTLVTSALLASRRVTDPTSGTVMLRVAPAARVTVPAGPVTVTAEPLRFADVATPFVAVVVRLGCERGDGDGAVEQ